MDIIGTDGGAKTCNDSVLLTSGNGAKVEIVIEFDGFEGGFPVSPVVILLHCGAAGDCVAGGKLHSQVIIFDLTMGGSGQSLKPSGTCLGMVE